MVRVTEKHFKTECRSAGLLVNVNAILYFKFHLQLKFRNNKNYSSIFVNFQTGTYITLKLKFMINKNSHEKKAPHWYNVTALLLKPQKRSLSSASPHSGFQKCFILDPFCSNALITVVLFLKMVWIMEFLRQNF
jgi:hypothetical protein